MNRFIDKLKLFFLGVFALSCAAVWAYQLLWVAPQKQCESRGDWWDPSSRACATPIYLPYLTGRPLGQLTPAQLKARAEQASAHAHRDLGLPAASAPKP